MELIFRVMVVCLLGTAVYPLNAQILINEVCPDNDAVIADEFGLFADWIELHNPTVNKISLEGFFLSDDSSFPRKWTFPKVDILPGEYLIIFASKGEDATIDLHTNFKLSKYGEDVVLSNPDGTVHDLYKVPAVLVDKSFGRSCADINENIFFDEPTPRQKNNDASQFKYNDPPFFSTELSYFVDSVRVALLSLSANVVIRYSTDGSVPDVDSPIYTDSIYTDTTMALRARSYSADALPSEVVSKTLFVNEHHDLPVVSISTDPDNLWSWERGLLVLGPNAETEFPFYGANFWSDTTIAVAMEYFINENLETSFNVGLKMHGGTSARTRLVKPMRLVGDSEFGDRIMDYPFFDIRNNSKYERLTLRNSGGDFNYAHFRSGFLSDHCLKEGLSVDVLAYQPVIVYLNGQYHGVMNLREKTGKQYIEQHYGVKENDLDLLEEDTLVIDGSFEIFDSMMALVLKGDITDSQEYDRASENFDIANFVDYFAVETMVCNTDWPNNNIKFWRDKKNESKWRFILFDMDVAMGRYPFTQAQNDVFGIMMKLEKNKIVNLFKAFLENDKFHNYFINRYADLLNSSFQEDYILAATKELVESIDLSMVPHFNKWGWPGHDGWHEKRLTEVYDFIMQRPAYARSFLLDYFKLNKEVLLDFAVFPSDAGGVDINSLSSLTFPWSGYYFHGVPVVCTPRPNLGFEFSHWELVNSSEEIHDPVLIKDFSSDEIVRAVFVPERLEFDLQIIPNPIVNTGSLVIELPSSSQISVQIYDAMGRLIKSEDYGVKASGRHTLILNTEELKPGYYQLYLNGNNKLIGKGFVKK